MVKKGDWVIVGDLHAVRRYYDPAIGEQGKVIGISGNSVEVQLYDEQGRPSSSWYISPVDAQPIYVNEMAVHLLHLEL